MRDRFWEIFTRVRDQRPVMRLRLSGLTMGELRRARRNPMSPVRVDLWRVV